jgi:hypothetical protein
LGQRLWPLVISSPERAFLELLDQLPQNETFHLADVTMEGLVNVNPQLMQLLLETTKGMKVKRRFFSLRAATLSLVKVDREGEDQQL